MPPRLSVLIPAYNEETHLVGTIASVHESFAAIGEAAYEVIVCDNNSTDRTASVAEELGAQVVFEPHNQIARARNTAAERSRAEWLIFLDADTALNPELLRATIRAFESGTVCGGGSTVRLDGPHGGVVGAGMLRLWNGISVGLSLAAGSYVYCLRQAWEESGGFDQTVYAGEELYFSRKLKRWGRERGLGFRILTTAPVITSARKMEWYSHWHMLRHFFLLARPGALRNRANCDLWYRRPDK